MNESAIRSKFLHNPSVTLYQQNTRAFGLVTEAHFLFLTTYWHLPFIVEIAVRLPWPPMTKLCYAVLLSALLPELAPVQSSGPVPSCLATTWKIHPT
jgi:hypothetical protein